MILISDLQVSEYSGLTFKDEQKIALLLAAGVHDNDVARLVGVDVEVVKKLKRSEEFKRLIQIFRDELNKEKLMAIVSNNEAAIEYWIRQRLFTMMQSVDYVLDWLLHQVMEGRDKGTSLANLMSSFSSLVNAYRQLAKDMHDMIYDREHLKLKAAQVQAKGMKVDSALISEEEIRQIVENAMDTIEVPEGDTDVR
ncbi:MAG: hypothetical protein J7L51_02355 [Desulfurococcales archaeon]|nr:hypothetical protein [Desulfurococcales archaeon]